MSEKILKALMQLFAIIARPESNTQDRRDVVQSFLKRQLNEEMVKEYLTVFDSYYQIHQERQKEEGKRTRRIASSSVRVLKICTEINEELTTRQKIVVLFQLLEFAKSDGNGVSITTQELEFILTVAETFNVPEDDFESLHSFVLYPFEKIPSTPNLLIIDNNPKFENEVVKHIFVETVQGQIRVLNVPIANMYLFRYIGSSEFYMNGQLIHQDKVYVFTSGSSIRDPKTKPIYYGDVISKFVEALQESKIIFEAKEIEYKFKGGKTGLHNLSFEAESGKMIGIMGASGAGKSTLLFVLNGTNSPSSGEVLLNGINIHTEKQKIEGLIGFVSQDDLLIEELTVYENLYYNAKLCFDNYTEQELQEAVDKVLMNLGLFEIKDIMVGSPLNKKISGGQRKRLNIALELIREPAVLFLDEPTSGLSSRDSENIMDLLKELTLKGKLVFVVIHQPSSDIFKMFDKLLILDTGGYLIYDGDPIESIIYFKSRIHHANWNESECHACGNVNPEQIFNIVESNVLDEYGKVTPARKISPKEWGNFFKDFGQEENKPEEIPTEIPKISFKIPNKIKQFGVFVKRDILSKLANTQYMVLTLLEAPVLGCVLAFLIKYYDVGRGGIGYTLLDNENLPVYLFMSVIIAIFMGLTVSAEEIIKDRKILKREAFLNLSWSSYLLSKVSVQFIISAIQAATYVIVGNTIMEIKGMYWQFWIVLFSAWASSNLMGLVISDSFKTVVTIYILIPFLVIPNIILSGVMVKFEKLNPKLSSPKNIPWYGEIIAARWGYEALAVYEFINNKYERYYYNNDKIRLIADFKKDFWANEMDNALNLVERNLGDAQMKETMEYNLKLLQNEIRKELGHNTQVTFAYADQLVPEKINAAIIAETRDYINTIRVYSRKVSNIGYSRRDEITNQIEEQVGRDGLIELKRKYRNDKLADFVTNANETEQIINYKGELIQKRNPIYLDPEHKFIKAHFYAPRKMLFGRYIGTLWINTIVIWILTILLYIALYFRVLKGFLDMFETFNLGFGKKET
jgi:ABC-type multidrug transport system ATPase subunit